MKPSAECYLVTEPWQYAACRKLWKAAVSKVPALGPVRRFGFPTVMAYKGNTVIGFLSSYRTAAGLVAGPLVLAPGYGVFTALRLVEAYEKVLTVAGVSSYLFSTDNPAFARVIERTAESAGIKKVLTDGGTTWYSKTIQRSTNEADYVGSAE